MTVPAPEPPFPLREVYFYLTEGCNLACRHCWLAPRFDADGSRHATLPLSSIRQVLDEAQPLGLRAVKLTGGEPLLHPDFDAIVDLLRDRHVSVRVETNGLLMTPERASALVACRNPFISVSIDGPDASTHEAIRGVKGAFDKACAAVKRLVASGLSPQVIMTVMRSNAGTVPAMVTLAEQLGARSLKLNVLQPTARGESLHEHDEALPVPEYLDLYARVRDTVTPHTALRIYVDVPLAFRPLSALHDEGLSRCGILGIIGVISTGKYALCGIGNHIPELVFGTIGEDALAEVWASHPTLQSLREGLPHRLEGICGRCLLRGACLGSCIAQNYYRHQSLWAPYWFCQEAETLGRFPASRLAPNPSSVSRG